MNSINENDLFDEFTEIKMIFKSIEDKNIPVYDQVQSYINKEMNPNMPTTAATTTSSNTQVEEQQENSNDDDNGDDDDDREVQNGVTKEIRSDQLWAMLLSIKPTPSSNLQQSIFFIFNPCSNAYVESVFLSMKDLYNDKRNFMSTELIASELKIRLNSSLSCTDIYGFLLSKPKLLKLIRSNEK
jgi:hypothetical protein